MFFTLCNQIWKMSLNAKVSRWMGFAMNNFYSDASIIILIFLSARGWKMAYKLTNDPNKLHINTVKFIKTMAIPPDRTKEKQSIWVSTDCSITYKKEKPPRDIKPSMIHQVLTTQNMATPQCKISFINSTFHSWRE